MDLGTSAVQNYQRGQNIRLANLQEQRAQEQAPIRNRLLELQGDRTQQDIGIARSQEARAKQESESNLATDRVERAKTLAPVVFGQMVRLRELPQEQRAAEVQRIAPGLRRLGAESLLEGLSVEDLNDQNLDRSIVDVGNLLAQTTGKDPFTSPFQAIDPVTGDTVWYQASKGGRVQSTGLEVPKSSSQVKFEAEQLEAENAKQARMENSRRQAATVGFDINRALDQAAGVFSTGFTGSIVSAVPGTPAHDLKNTLTTIRANVGFNELQKMREASPTGGALGQVTNRENELLQSVLGSLEQSQTEQQLTSNLRRIGVIFDSIVNGTTPIPFTQEEYDKLPSGATFLDPDDGTVLRKP